jgi:hypothetical protein
MNPVAKITTASQTHGFITMQKILSLLGFCLVASAVQASDLSIALSNKTVSLDYVGATQNGTLQTNMGGFHHSNNGDMASLGVHVSQSLNPQAQASVGFKGVGLFNDQKNSAAIALGGSFKVALPMAQNLYFGAHAWYAPSVVSSNQVKNFRDVGTQLGYQLLDNAALFVDYRFIQVNYDSQVNMKLFEGSQAGIQLTF